MGVVIALGGGLTGGNRRAVTHRPASAFEPSESRLFDYRFIECRHPVTQLRSLTH